MFFIDLWKILLNGQSKQRITISSHQSKFNFIMNVEFVPSDRDNTFQIWTMYGIVTYWTFPPRMVGQRQIMKNTWPAKYMTTSCNFGCKEKGKQTVSKQNNLRN